MGRLEAELRGVHAENTYLNTFEARQHGQIGLQPGYLRLQPKAHRVAAWPGGPWHGSMVKVHPLAVPQLGFGASSGHARWL